jgi:hypothetical protein
MTYNAECGRAAEYLPALIERCPGQARVGVFVWVRYCHIWLIDQTLG